MFRNLFRKKKNIDVIAKRELRANFDVIQSLKEYDQGKKTISTDRVSGRMQDLQTSQ
jgi:hypothetical protein